MDLLIDFNETTVESVLELTFIFIELLDELFRFPRCVVSRLNDPVHLPLLLHHAGLQVFVAGVVLLNPYFQIFLVFFVLWLRYQFVLTEMLQLLQLLLQLFVHV